MGQGTNPGGDKTETDAFRAHLHQSRRGSRRPDKQPLGKAACTQPYHLGKRERAWRGTFTTVTVFSEGCKVGPGR